MGPARLVRLLRSQRAPPMIKVFGHPRSGNHLLASMLHKAFFPHLDPIIKPNKSTGHWTKRHTTGRYCIEGEDQGKGMLAIPYVWWNPSGGKAKIGAWRDLFSEKLEALFDEKVPMFHVGRWENKRLA